MFCNQATESPEMKVRNAYIAEDQMWSNDRGREKKVSVCVPLPGTKLNKHNHCLPRDDNGIFLPQGLFLN